MAIATLRAAPMWLTVMKNNVMVVYVTSRSISTAIMTFFVIQ